VKGTPPGYTFETDLYPAERYEAERLEVCPRCKGACEWGGVICPTCDGEGRVEKE